MHKPKIPEYFDIVFLSPERLEFRSCTVSFVLRGESVAVLRKLLPYLEGKLTLEDIQQESGISAKDVRGIVEKLHQSGLLFDEEQTKGYGLPRPLQRWHQEEAIFFSRKVGYLERYEPLKKLQGSSVLLIGLGPIGTHVMASLLRSGIGSLKIVDNERIQYADLVAGFYSELDIGELRTEAAKQRVAQFAHHTHVEACAMQIQDIQETDLIRNADLVVLCPDRMAPHAHRLVNKACLQDSGSWISARLDGDSAEVGPMVIPRKTACFVCYELRMKSNIDDLEAYLAFERHLETPTQGYGALASFPQVIAGYLSLEVTRMLTGFEQPITLGAVLSIDFLECRTSVNHVLRVPDCPVCGAR